MWPHVEPMFRSAIERTAMGTLADIKREVLHGNALLWVAWDGKSILAAWATVLQPEDAGLVCVVLACGGRAMQEWLPHVGKIEDYARAEGCARTRVTGRKGWSEVLDGYREKHVVLEKELAS